MKMTFRISGLPGHQKASTQNLRFAVVVWQRLNVAWLKLDGYIRDAGVLARVLEQLRGKIDSAHVRSGPRSSDRNDTGATRDIENILAGPNICEFDQASCCRCGSSATT